MQDIIRYVKTQHDRYLDELKTYLAIPSISGDSEKEDSMLKAAEHTAELLRRAGCTDSKVNLTTGNPVVTGSRIVDDKLPTILIYGHYDVQPVDPLELWNKDPFEAYVKDDTIIARGSADDKGQVFIHIKALEAYKESGINAPVNLKFIIEGEEEVGSPSLAPFLVQNKELLSADQVLVSDTSMWAKGIPAITYGLKGITYLEFELTGPNRDLHSGEYGGAVANPAEIICRMITHAKDKDGRIQIPGFYERVRTISDDERRIIAQAPFDESNYKKELDVDDLWGETGYSTVERLWVRPTFEVNGIWGGYTEAGSKTVLPAKAAVKVSMRLVPDQDPHEIAELTEKFFRSIMPGSMKMTFKKHETGFPFVALLDSPYIKAAARALKEAFDREPLMIRVGGSIPIVTEFKNILGLDTLLVGYCLPGCRAHSPNENLHLPTFFAGIESQVRMMRYFGELSSLKGKR